MAENFKLKNKICIIDPLCDERWDKFVEKHPLGGIFHLSGWKNVLESSFNHIKGYYLVHMDNAFHNIKCALPVFNVNSKLLGNRLVSIPFATLCDPLVSNFYEYQILFDAALKIYLNLKCKYFKINGFLSTPLIYDERTIKTNQYQTHYLEINNSLDSIFKSFHRSCVRQKINRALKSDVKVVIGRDEDDLKSFYKVYIKTRKRVARPIQPYRYFNKIWKVFHLSNQMTLLLAKIGNQTIGGVLLLKYKNRVSAEFAASDEDYLYLFPNHYLFWESIQLAHREGYKIFDFGRTHISNKNLSDFKKRWGTKVINISEFYYPKKVAKKASRKENSWKFLIMSRMCKQGPAFFNKAIGNFFYRHLG